MKGRIKKSIWLPSVLAIYFMAMMAMFGPGLVRKGETARFITVSVIEIIIIILVHLFFKKRERGGN